MTPQQIKAVGVVTMVLLVLAVIVVSVIKAWYEKRMARADAPFDPADYEEPKQECHICGKVLPRYGEIRIEGRIWAMEWSACAGCTHRVKLEIQKKVVELGEHLIDRYNQGRGEPCEP